MDANKNTVFLYILCTRPADKSAPKAKVDVTVTETAADINNNCQCQKYSFGKAVLWQSFLRISMKQKKKQNRAWMEVFS